MASASFYIYRNLHLEDTFSIRLRGRVVDRLVNFVAHDVRFKVNEAGRLKVLESKHKNVHAFIVTRHYEPTQLVSLGLTRVSYNPYRSNTFEVLGEPIYQANRVLFAGGQCFILVR